MVLIPLGQCIQLIFLYLLFSVTSFTNASTAWGAFFPKRAEHSNHTYFTALYFHKFLILPLCVCKH